MILDEISRVWKARVRTNKKYSYEQISKALIQSNPKEILQTEKLNTMCTFHFDASFLVLREVGEYLSIPL